MYYTYRCTYCQRAFYTFDRNKHHASVTLYRAVKHHLIEYGEDHKEHEMDDGEVEDSQQIYLEMTESPVEPHGAYKAAQLSSVPEQSTEEVKQPEPSVAHSGVHGSAETFKIVLAMVLFLLILFLGAFIFVPSFAEFITNSFVLPF